MAAHAPIPHTEIATVPGFHVAIARSRSLPHVFDHVHATYEAAMRQRDQWDAEDAAAFGPNARKTGDFVVIPALADHRAYISSWNVRLLARDLEAAHAA